MVYQNILPLSISHSCWKQKFSLCDVRGLHSTSYSVVPKTESRFRRRKPYVIGGGIGLDIRHVWHTIIAGKPA